MKFYILCVIYIPVFWCWLLAELIYMPFEVLGLFIKNKIDIEYAKRKANKK